MLLPFNMNIRVYHLLWYQKASRLNVQCQQVNKHATGKVSGIAKFLVR